MITKEQEKRLNALAARDIDFLHDELFSEEALTDWEYRDEVERRIYEREKLLAKKVIAKLGIR